MAGARTRDRFLVILGAIDVFNRQRFGPVLPILVLDQDGDGRPDGVRVPDSADDVGLICLDFHAPTAAEPLLAAPQFPVNRRDGDRDSSGQSSQSGDKALPVRFSCGFKAKHGIFYGSNNRWNYWSGLGWAILTHLRVIAAQWSRQMT